MKHHNKYSAALLLSGPTGNCFSSGTCNDTKILHSKAKTMLYRVLWSRMPRVLSLVRWIGWIIRSTLQQARHKIWANYSRNTVGVSSRCIGGSICYEPIIAAPVQGKVKRGLGVLLYNMWLFCNGTSCHSWTFVFSVIILPRSTYWHERSLRFRVGWILTASRFWTLVTIPDSQ